MTYKVESSGYRPEIKGLKIIDIGGANSFAHGYLDALIDIRTPQAAAEHIFVGNIDFPEIWKDVLFHVKKHGKWDYAICTHTLEDINNPLLATRMIEQIAKAGLIVVPSKHRELARFSGTFRGYIHHRWIFDVIGNRLTAFPKINWIEDERFDKVSGPQGREELIVEWTGSIDMEYINEGMPYGTASESGEEHIRSLYNLLLNETN